MKVQRKLQYPQMYIKALNKGHKVIAVSITALHVKESALNFTLSFILSLHEYGSE